MRPLPGSGGSPSWPGGSGPLLSRDLGLKGALEKLHVLTGVRMANPDTCRAPGAWARGVLSTDERWTLQSLCPARHQWGTCSTPAAVQEGNSQGSSGILLTCVGEEKGPPPHHGADVCDVAHPSQSTACRSPSGRGSGSPAPSGQPPSPAPENAREEVGRVSLTSCQDDLDGNSSASLKVQREPPEATLRM